MDGLFPPNTQKYVRIYRNKWNVLQSHSPAFRSLTLWLNGAIVQSLHNVHGTDLGSSHKTRWKRVSIKIPLILQCLTKQNKEVSLNCFNHQLSTHFAKVFYCSTVLYDQRKCISSCHFIRIVWYDGNLGKSKQQSLAKGYTSKDSRPPCGFVPREPSKPWEKFRDAAKDLHYDLHRSEESSR